MCIGIDGTTQSVYLRKGIAYGKIIGYYVPGACDADDVDHRSPNITFDNSIDGGSHCHPVVRDASDASNTRVHDIEFRTA